MKFSAIGLCAVLVGVCLLSNPVTTKADEIADLKALVEAQRIQISALTKLVEVQQATVTKLEGDVKSLKEVQREDQTQIANLRKDYELKVKGLNTELAVMGELLRGKVPYASLPSSVLFDMELNDIPLDVKKGLAILLVKNSSGSQRELIVEGTSYTIPSNGREYEIKVRLKPDQRELRTELRGYEPAKDKKLELNKSNILEAKMEIILRQLGVGER